MHTLHAKDLLNHTARLVSVSTAKEHFVVQNVIEIVHGPSLLVTSR